MTSADDFVLQLIQDKQLVEPDVVATARTQLESEGKTDHLDTATLQLLIEKNYLTDQQIIAVLAEEFSMETVDLTDVRVSQSALEKCTYDIADRYGVMPIELDGNQLDMAVSDPLDMDTIDSLSHLLKVSINARLATPAAIRAAIKQYYESEEARSAANLYAEFQGDLSPDSAGVDLPTGEDGAVKEEEAPIIRYVHLLITEAIKRRASDIHLEPLEKRFRVRYRIDGVLQEVENPPKRLQPSIISRLKLMANISIAEKRVPQDGRIQIKMPQRDIDLRVSSLPTVYGESIVMRILDKEGLMLGLPDLGFFSDDQESFQRLVALPDGIFLVTGPTGSGKSTTLYSALNYINHPDRKIITVEDPVEYQMTGINQVQVRREVGMTFSAALRAMLRQAPNIIMIGEIRDLETAEIAVNASLTGHMVFSTLHTNDAPSAVARLVDIGVKPFLVSASLRGALAQRLVRRICKDCKQPGKPDPREAALLGYSASDLETINFQRGAGCPRCNGRGYRGRMGIFEMFVVNEEIQQMIYEARTLVELRTKARELGMRSMREDGIRKINSGQTTVEEVLEVTVSDSF